eukprot:scaffold695_cov384-Prasinococcus_capsulatus_cf.AAC.20
MAPATLATCRLLPLTCDRKSLRRVLAFGSDKLACRAAKRRAIALPARNVGTIRCRRPSAATTQRTVCCSQEEKVDGSEGTTPALSTEKQTYSTALGLVMFSSVLAASYIVGDAAMMEAGDYIAAALWSASLYFVQPLQVILLFLAKTDTSRPSDFVLRRLGTLAGEDVDDVKYEVPWSLQLATVSLCFLSGIAIAAVGAEYFYVRPWKPERALCHLSMNVCASVSCRIPFGASVPAWVTA